MVCIYCHSNTSVINSREQAKMLSVWRRRRCVGCKAIATTIESYRLEDVLRVKKRDGSMEPFYRDKLYISVRASLLPSHDASNVATQLCATVIQQILKKRTTGALIASSDIRKAVDKTLHRFKPLYANRYRLYAKH